MKREPIRADPETGKVDKSKLPLLRRRRYADHSKYDSNGRKYTKQYPRSRYIRIPKEADEGIQTIEAGGPDDE